MPQLVPLHECMPHFTSAWSQHRITAHRIVPHTVIYLVDIPGLNLIEENRLLTIWADGNDFYGNANKFGNGIHVVPRIFGEIIP